MNDGLGVFDVFDESNFKRIGTKVFQEVGNVNKKCQSIKDQIETLEKKVHKAKGDGELQQILSLYSSKKSVQEYHSFLEGITKFLSKITDRNLLNFWIQAKVPDSKFEGDIKKFIHEFEQHQIAVKEVSL